MMKLLRVAFGLVLFLIPHIAAADATSEVKELFQRFVAAQNNRDVDAFRNLLLESPDFLWLGRGAPVWGRDAVLQNLESGCQGKFYVDPVLSEFKAIERGGNVVEIFTPAIFAPAPPPNQPVQQMMLEKYFISQVLVKASGGWRIASMIWFPTENMPRTRC
jgi:hypothetical protein